MVARGVSTTRRRSQATPEVTSKRPAMQLKATRGSVLPSSRCVSDGQVANESLGQAPLAMAMSIIVFAGAAQLAAISLMAQNAPGGIVVLTVLIVNLRMMMYSAAMAPLVKPLPVRWQRGLAFVLSDQAFARVASDPVPRLSAARVMEHSYTVARLARTLAQHDGAGRLQRDGSFSAGLLHDLGKLIVAEACPERYRRCLEMAAQRHILLHEAERDVFDATHAGLAGYLFALWGLPPVIFEGVAQHHSIGEALATGQVDPRNLSDPQMVALRVHVADLCEHLRDGEGTGYAAEAGLARLAGTPLGPRVAEWRRTLTDNEERRPAA